MLAFGIPHKLVRLIAKTLRKTVSKSKKFKEIFQTDLELSNDSTRELTVRLVYHKNP